MTWISLMGGVGNFSSNNRRIVRNVEMLYVRMSASMLVSLYISCVFLNVLSVKNYVTFGVIGGVVAMIAFEKSSEMAVGTA